MCFGWLLCMIVPLTGVRLRLQSGCDIGLMSIWCDVLVADEETTSLHVHTQMAYIGQGACGNNIEPVDQETIQCCNVHLYSDLRDVIYMII